MTAEEWAGPFWVYEFTDASGAYLYIGCTDDIARRLKNHRTKEWWPQVARIEVDVIVDYRSAAASERKRIERHQPTHNVFYTERHDRGGWHARRARMAAAHAIGNRCLDPACMVCRSEASA